MKTQSFRTFLSEVMNGNTTALTANVLQAVQANKGRTMDWEEEAESTGSKIDMARSIFAQMVNAPNTTRKQIIHAMMKRAGVTHSTAVSYYERLAKEAGITNKDVFDRNKPQVAGMTANITTPTPTDTMTPAAAQMPDEQQVDIDDTEVEHTFPDNPNKQGIIRRVDKAHLVYKRQTPDGTFEELWVYNIGPDMRDELTIRRNILAGTDIPAQKTRSPDGSQSYSLTTLGNGQLLLIKGLNQ